MKLLFLSLIIASIPAFGQQVPQQTPVPPEVMLQAQAATQKMLDQVVRGNFKAKLNSIHPGYAKIAARAHGGVAKMKQKLLEHQNAQVAQGVVVQTATATQPFNAREVKLVKGAFRDWMVLVPVEKIYTGFDRSVSPPKKVRLLSRTFQVAISQKGSNRWTFIDGSQLRPLDLRKVFHFIPQDKKRLGFPPVEVKILK